MGESKRRKQQEANYGKVKNPVKNLMKIVCPFFEDYEQFKNLDADKISLMIAKEGYKETGLKGIILKGFLAEHLVKDYPPEAEIIEGFKQHGNIYVTSTLALTYLENSHNKAENLQNFENYNPLNEFIRIESDAKKYDINLVTV
ncbi:MULTISPECIES: hypothetical protein [unclassified Tolypothrix]|uniref:hypothetical protein n=1 Tax=unclassified Tolypothrix TaxID=2649714 RepID=UPI0005EAAE91|nr:MULTISPECIES: hypothetical protein [unclassified Tolypothrix]BAY94710.1 hypothetical protein NIES3275_67620 [Microchaete diplosiphon NIES-3275]EKE99057.1 hypothetical protein FDUTEX481_03249 [Tolypothrix sp. PCC 7601]MBE9081378.1 hypothetical protein [Tolypothrix sp. LEGE 11397]UYD28403.1 hypothetical protein HGR01_10375 [Tolypothrix sp. PCC 7712]UYD35719.1 hypothetical protein HG267_08190 [Tolypothrix sp. PCC 7601]